MNEPVTCGGGQRPIMPMAVPVTLRFRSKRWRKALRSGFRHLFHLHRKASGLAVGLFLAVISIAFAAAAQSQTDLARQRSEYDANQPKTIMALQPLRSVSTAQLTSGTAVRLISLNPGVNAWFVLQTGTKEGGDLKTYHIENPDPRGQTLTLGASGGLQLASAAGPMDCDLFSGSPPAIASAEASGLSYAPICGGRLYLRMAFHDTSADRDRSAAFLQDHVWHDTTLAEFDSRKFYDSGAAQGLAPTASPAVGPATGPGAAQLDPTRPRPVVTANLGLGLLSAPRERMGLGLWYPVAGIDGVFASVLRPDAIDPAILHGPGRTNPLDAVEAQAPVYLISFDLSRFELGYALGNRHPRVGWSPRPRPSVRTPGLPGPDGIDSSNPLVRLGMISPALTNRAVAVFTGGYKRLQGAFKFGPFSTVNEGTHYGFLQDGTIFSKLHTGLVTLYGLTDGTIGMKTWDKADNALLPQLVFARQNGVALIEPDASGKGIPGPYVAQWGPGNWSGSAKGHLRTERGGACLRDANGTTYLIYALFSSATPSAMARTFEAYGCRTAMLLDMNAPVFTYLALYVHDGGTIEVEHLVPSMAESDKSDSNGRALPRFLSFPDERDFFYLLRKQR
ncbi:hypothetical protein [Solirhodobacter olei]|uniref:hypothetical protein n=1 Tax=Solirhodobacter olei TaxID=2493082 RepID=UPI000FDBACB1|nr:hypothetical protein [Solirhodobacter olei]